MSTNKLQLYKGMKYAAIALLFIIAAPVLITIGFKALKDDIYSWLIAGCILAILGIGLGFKGLQCIVGAFFDTNK
ncbi:MAG: hypothetical protein COB98_07855 [Flavobacteriaceae bacterium]|nr:MAG: hypothetical protein COB98_07855 [Flavobacteriaceae bacterium]